MKKSYVYVLPLLDKSTFKVGKTKNPTKRITELSRYYIFNKNDCILIECDSQQKSYQIENILHQTFNKSRIILEYTGGTEFFNFNIYNDFLIFLNIIIKQKKLKIVKFEYKLDKFEENDSKLLLISIGEAIKRKRLILNISLEKLSNICNVTPKTIRKLEQGSNISLLTLIKIFSALGIKSFENICENICNDIPFRKRASKKINVSFNQH